MAVEIIIPSVGESVQEAVLAEWFKKDGDLVQKDEPLFVIETDKVTLEVVAEVAGVLKIVVAEGETVAIGMVVGSIESSDAVPASAPPDSATKAVKPPEPDAPAAAPVPSPATPSPPPPPPTMDGEQPPMPPSVRRLIAEKNLDVTKIKGTGPGGRINKGDVLLYLEQAPAGIPDKLEPPPDACLAIAGDLPVESRKPMSPIRKRSAARLLESKLTTAMLTTFNEIDMGQAMAIRARYKEAFQKKHGVSLGFMSFLSRPAWKHSKRFPKSTPLSTETTSSTIITSTSVWRSELSADWSCRSCGIPRK